MPPGDELEALEIVAHPKEIFTMSKGELRERFSYLNGKIEASRLIRNLLWQDRMMLQAGLLSPIRGNIRSYWYQRVKPVLGRAQTIDFDEKYPTLISELRDLVIDHQLVRYADFGFIDESAHQRELGSDNAHIWCVAEKVGHLELLRELNQIYGVTVYALGGQPSALGSENFLRLLKEASLDKGECVMVSIVDYDPSGLSIIESFMHQLSRVGFAGQLRHFSLIHPEHMTAEQIRLNRYRLPRSSRQKTRNEEWVARTGGLTAYGSSGNYGLEADAMSWEEITQIFERLIIPYLTTPLSELRRRRLNQQLLAALKATLLERLFR